MSRTLTTSTTSTTSTATTAVEPYLEYQGMTYNGKYATTPTDSIKVNGVFYVLHTGIYNAFVTTSTDGINFTEPMSIFDTISKVICNPQNVTSLMRLSVANNKIFVTGYFGVFLVDEVLQKVVQISGTKSHNIVYFLNKYWIADDINIYSSTDLVSFTGLATAVNGSGGLAVLGSKLVALTFGNALVYSSIDGVTFITETNMSYNAPNGTTYESSVDVVNGILIVFCSATKLFTYTTNLTSWTLSSEAYTSSSKGFRRFTHDGTNYWNIRNNSGSTINLFKYSVLSSASNQYSVSNILLTNPMTAFSDGTNIFAYAEGILLKTLVSAPNLNTTAYSANDPRYAHFGQASKLTDYGLGTEYFVNNFQANSNYSLSVLVKINGVYKPIYITDFKGLACVNNNLNYFALINNNVLYIQEKSSAATGTLYAYSIDMNGKASLINSTSITGAAIGLLLPIKNGAVSISGNTNNNICLYSNGFAIGTTPTDFSKPIFVDDYRTRQKNNTGLSMNTNTFTGISTTFNVPQITQNYSTTDTWVANGGIDNPPIKLRNRFVAPSLSLGMSSTNGIAFVRDVTAMSIPIGSSYLLLWSTLDNLLHVSSAGVHYVAKDTEPVIAWGEVVYTFNYCLVDNELTVYCFNQTGQATKTLHFKYHKGA